MKEKEYAIMMKLVGENKEVKYFFLHRDYKLVKVRKDDGKGGYTVENQILADVTPHPESAVIFKDINEVNKLIEAIKNLGRYEEVLIVEV